MWQPTCHCPWSGGGGGIRAITCVHLFPLTQVARLVLSDLVPFTRVIDIMKLLYLFEAEMPSESSIQTFLPSAMSTARLYQACSWPPQPREGRRDAV